MMHKKTTTVTHLGLIAVMLTLFMVPFAQETRATTYVTSVSDVMSSLKKSTASSHTITFVTPTGATDATDTIVITFPSDFNFTGKTEAMLSFTHGVTTGLEATETLAASPTAAAWGAAFSGTQNRVLTLTAPSDGTGSAAVSAGHKLIITYTAGLSYNPSTSGPYQVYIDGLFGDMGSYTVYILDDDQVVVTGTVNQSLTFAISDNSIAFGTLTSSNARFAGGAAGTDGPGSSSAHNLTIATNAPTGYNITYNGTTLTSGGNTITAATITGDQDGAPNSAQFAIGFTRDGDATIATAYNQVTPNFNYSFVPSVTTTIVSEVVPTATETIAAFYLANISGLTKSGIYTSTITYTATANY